jgi:predicted amidohydrolase YtcJ
VVTQPGFIYWNGDQYKRQVSGCLLPHIYPITSLVRAGVPVAFGSDAPVIDPNPWPGIYAALSRTTEEGNRLPCSGGSDQFSVFSALGMYTRAGARSEGTGRRKGAIAAGYFADMTLMDGDPTRLELDRIKAIKAVMTIVDGKVGWDDGVAGGGS